MGYIAMCALSRAKNELAADDESSMVVMPMRRALGLMVFVLAVAGCAAQGPYRRGEQAIEQVVADPALCQELKAPSSLRIPVAFVRRVEGAVKPTPETANKLMVVGHCFGASVVCNSIGQILLARFILDAERLASAKPTPRHAQSKPGLVSGYGDLVVLVNPAIEATRIVPFFAALNEYTRTRVALLSPVQPPRLVILSSKGDWATRGTFSVA